MDNAVQQTTATPNLTVGAVREQPLNSSPDQSAGINYSIPSVWEKYKVTRPKNPWEVTNLNEIMETEYPPLGFSIDGFLPHGLVVLAGEPKIGKSMFIQQLAYAVATGTELMGRYMGTRGDVIYLALEDNCRRLQERFSRYESTPLDAYENIHIIFRAEGVDQNFVGQIYYLLEKYPNTQLILVDTLQYVRGKVSEKYSYEAEYKMMLEFRKITQSFPVSLVLVTHTREMDAKNAQRQIYGGGGIIGASDGNWTLVETEQTATEKHACLSMTNRDIDSNDLDLIFDGEISRDEFLADNERYRNEIQTLELQIADLKTNVTGYSQKPAFDMDTIKATLDRWIDFSEATIPDALIDQFILQVVVIDDNTFNWTLDLFASDAAPRIKPSQIAWHTYWNNQRNGENPDTPIDVSLSRHIANPSTLFSFTITKQEAADYCKKIGMKFFASKWHDKTIIVSM